jgi:protein TonB
MDLKRNLVISAVLHVMLFAAVLPLVGRATGTRVPPVVIDISLVAETLQSLGGPKPAQEPRRQAAESALVPAAAPKRTEEERTKASAPMKETVVSVPQTVSAPARQESGLTSSSQPGGSGVASGNPAEAGGPGVSGDTGHHVKGGQTASPSGVPHAAVSAVILQNIKARIESVKAYPLMARRRGTEGSVLVEFAINAKGMPENIAVLRSSGSEVLDAAAKMAIIKAAPFPDFAGSIEVPITYRIEK